MAGAYAIAVSPGSYVVEDPVPGEPFEFRFDFFREDGGIIYYSKSYEGGARPGEPGYEDEMLWLSSLILPEPSEHTEWIADTNAVIIAGVWPDFQVPGERKLYIVGNEPNEGGGMMSAAASVKSRITIRVSYDGIYLSPSITVDNVPEEESAVMQYTVRNIGKLHNYTAVIDYYISGENGYSERGVSELVSNSSTVKGEIDLGLLESGKYEVVSFYEVDGRVWNATDTFIVADDTLVLTCSDVILSAGVKEVRLSLSSGFIEDKYFDYSVRVDGAEMDSGAELIAGLTDHEIRTTFSLEGYEDGDYVYDFVVGNFECEGNLQIKSAARKSLSISVYLGIALIILVIVCFAYWYYYSREDDTETDF